MAYAASAVGCLISAGLTSSYVGGVAVEANPVVRWVILTTGMEAMILLKLAVAVGAYWGYYWLGRRYSAPHVAVGFAWLGAAVNLADALHDLRMAAIAGPPETVVPGHAALLVVGAAAVVLLRPPSRV